MITYKTFKEPRAAEDLAFWLKRRGIEAEVYDTSANFDPSFANSIVSKELAVRINAGDFKKATELHRQFYRNRLQQIPQDYYLFSFTDSELIEILAKPDEWGDLDYILAQQILHDRGIEITDEHLEDLRNKRYEALSQPEEQDTGGNIVWGYGLSLAAGIIGSLIGWHLMSSLKTLPDGKTIYRYPPAARAHGRRIFQIGMIITLLFFLVGMYVRYQENIGRWFAR